MSENRAIGRSLLRVGIHTALLLVICNGLFWLGQPGLLEQAGRISLYGSLFDYRPRLPYGENISESYSVTLNNIPAMMASHSVNRPKDADEFRIVVLGDSATWGWLQRPEETVVGQLNQHGVTFQDGRRVVFYNLGYPVLSLTKDALLLEEALKYEPDLVIWVVTLESLALDQQDIHPLVQENASRVAALGLTDVQGNNSSPWWRETVVGRRRDLADLVRLQLLGGGWTATGIDQVIPEERKTPKNDLDPDTGWRGIDAAGGLTVEAVALPVLETAIDRSAVPLIVVNEPIFLASGANSEVRYNSLYPKWAYDQYRDLLEERLAGQGVPWLDYWDAIPPAEFTDSPVHLTPAGAHLFADLLAADLEKELRK